MAGQNSSWKGPTLSALTAGGSRAPSRSRRGRNSGIGIAAAEPKFERGGSLRNTEAIATRLQALEEMDCSALRGEWRRLYRVHPPRRVSRDLLMLGVAWKIQEQAFGGLGTATRRRVADLAETLERDGDVTRSRAAHLKPGAKLVREWRGETHTVAVIEDGFEWKGRHWRTLSAIARQITGGHWSGPRFFGLKDKARTNDEYADAETGNA